MDFLGGGSLFRRLRQRCLIVFQRFFQRGGIAVIHTPQVNLISNRVYQLLGLAQISMGLPQKAAISGMSKLS